MYRIEVGGVPDGSGWDLQPYKFYTKDDAFKFALGILRVNFEGGVNLSNLTVSIIGPAGSSEMWSFCDLAKRILADKYLFPVRKISAACLRAASKLTEP